MRKRSSTDMGKVIHHISDGVRIGNEQDLEDYHLF